MHSKKDFNMNAADKRLDNTMGATPANGNRATADNSRDSMMASLLIDCFFGGAINEFLGDMLDVPAGMDDLDIVNTIDLADEFWTDRQNSIVAGQKKNRANGPVNGGFELGDRGALRGGFNMNSARNAGKEWDISMDAMAGKRAAEQDDVIGFYSPAPAVSAFGGGFAAKTAAPAPA